MKIIPFTTITLGTKKPSFNGVSVSTHAQELLDKITYQKDKEEIELIILTPADLGFTYYPTTLELFARAKEKGYELFPPEVGPRLAGTLKESMYLYIAHETITDSGGRPSVFRVERDGDGKQWLDADWAGPDDQWGLGGRFVFRLGKGLRVSEHLNSSDTLDLVLRVTKLEQTLEAVRKALEI